MPVSADHSRRRFLTGTAAATALAGCSGARQSARPRKRRAHGASPALLLPLSGQQAVLGQRMAKAVWLQEDLGGSSGSTLVLDAGDTPEQASSAAQRALAQGANLLVGPLLRSQTPAVVQAAGSTPVMSLSNDDALTQEGAWVFGVTPRQSADAVLRYAKSSKSNRVAVLDNGDSLTERAFAALNAGSRRARLKGISKVPATTEPQNMTAALRDAGAGSLPDILYVPTAGQKAQAQAIAALGSGITTIGSLQWSGLSRDAFLRLDKACYTGPDPVSFGRMSATYSAQLDDQMGVIAALAVDAVNFAHQVGGQKSLAARTPVEGLLGQSKFLSDRTLQRELAVLRINNGGVERVA